MVEQVRATLERFRVRFDRCFSERALHEGGRDRGRRSSCSSRAGHVYSSEGATWLRTTELRRRQGPRAAPLLRRAHLLRVRHRLPPGQARARLRPADQRAGRRPSRLRRADAGRLRGARWRSRQARGDHHAARPRRRARRARADVQAPGRVRHARRADRRHRRRCRALLHARSARTTRRSTSTSTSRASSSQENPVYYVQYAHARIASILRNAGEELLSRARAGRPRRGLARGSSPPSARSSSGCSSCPRRSARRPSGARRTGSRPTRTSVASDFHAFYRDCRVVGAEPAELEELRVCICVATRDVIARSLDLLGVEAPEQM